MLSELGHVQGDKIGGEGDSDVFQRNRAEYPPETRLECVAKPRHREEREEIGAEYADPEEHHGAGGSGRDVNDPKDEPDMNELSRSEGEAHSSPRRANPSRRGLHSHAIAPPAYASQKRRKDHLAVARRAIAVPRSPTPKMTSTITANASAMRKAAAIHDNVVVGNQPIQRPLETRFSRVSRYTHSSGGFLS